MTVLHLIDSLAPGGAQTALQAVMECPDARDLHLAVLRTAPSALVFDSERVHLSASASRFSLAPLTLVRRLISEHRVQILHCHLLRSQVFGLLTQRLFFPHLKLIFQEHGQILGSAANRAIDNGLYRLFIRLASSRVNHFFANSRHTLDALIACAPGIRDKSTIVFNPIRAFRPRAFRAPNSAPELRARLGIAPETFVIGFAARIIASKGWRDLLEAVRRLLPRRDIFILIAGEGPDRDQLLNALSRPPFSHRHHWLGLQQDMTIFFDSLDCLVVPSHREAQGLVQIEAQSREVPVVVANLPGMGETLTHEENALLFQPHNVTELAQCIERLLADDMLRQRLVRGGVSNARRFNACAYIRAIEAVYPKICG